MIACRGGSGVWRPGLYSVGRLVWWVGAGDGGSAAVAVAPMASSRVREKTEAFVG